MDTGKKLTAEELEAMLGTEPLFYLKFTSDEAFVDDIVQGRLYANTADTFRRIELENGEHGQGDKNELCLSLPFSDLQVIDPETGACVLSAPYAEGTLSFPSDDLHPIVCFTGMPLREMKTASATHEAVELALPFSEAEYAEIERLFGKYCAIVDAKALTARLQQYCRVYSCEYVLKRVTYCESNHKEKADAYLNGSTDRFFFKDKALSYQREYRLLLSQELPSDHFIRLDPLRDKAVIVKIEQLRELRFNFKRL